MDNQAEPRNESDQYTPFNRRTFMAGAGQLALGTAILGGAGISLAGCGQSSTTGSSSSGGSGTAALGVAQTPDTLDPGSTDLLAVSEIDYSMFDPLVWLLPNGQRVPGLAEAVSANSNATVYTLGLRKGVKFHDGTPFTAAAVKATFDHIVSPSTRAGSGIGYLGPYKETIVVNDYTVQVVFKSSYAAFYNNMTSISLAPSSPTALTKYGHSYGQHPVGTGPFKFTSYLIDNEVTVTRNPDYNWGIPQIGTGPAALSGLTYRILTDPAAQASALATGELQLATNLSPGQLKTAEQQGNQILTASTTGMPWGVEINYTKPPTNDILVRRALIAATDSQSIVKTLYSGFVGAADGILTPGMLGYTPDASASYNPTLAGQLLDQAGWKLSPGAKTRTKAGQSLLVKFVVAANFGFTPIAELMQAQFQAVGISSTISQESFPAIQTVFNDGGQNLNFWFYTSPDPSVLSTVFTCSEIATGGYNWSHYCDTQVSNTLLTASGIADPAARASAYITAEQQINNAAVWIPIQALDYNYATSKSLSGVKFIAGLPIMTSARN
jgi:peptide/nickel transport system substrate-binding protein